MHRSLTDTIKLYLIRNKNRKWFRRLVRVLACAVVFCTTYALILPAITLEQEAFCGLEEHIHTEVCYNWQSPQSTLVCSAQSLGLHTHSSECYGTDNVLLCGQADYVVHSHDASCLNGEGQLVCTLEERSAHVHADACYAPAETQAPVLHVHSDACHSQQKGDLTCTQEEREGHTHAAACYTAGQTLECTLTENHVHGADCYIDTLICTQSTDPHAHSSGCYGTGDLQCTIPENHTHGESCHVSSLTCESTEEGHVHGDSCYTTQTVCTTAENHSHSASCYASILICGVEEGQAHSHGSECYSSEKTLNCTLTENHTHTSSCYDQILHCTTLEDPGHSHDDNCYAWNDVISCGLEEGQPEPTEATEPVLICTEPAAQVHVHGEACFEISAMVNTPVCGITEEDHLHTYSCGELICTVEAHEHTLSCYSDPEADVETPAIWEATFADVILTGDRYKDLVAIAETQLGYTESTKNYVVWEDNSIHGYTRYGDWYGVPHGDWCAMFVSFCLNYAEVDNIPINYGVRPWIEDLTDLELYHSAGEYSPKSGDIIFYDWEGDGLSDHVGIVAEIQEATEHTDARIKAIEGNSSNCVQYVYYDPEDPVILGYSELPEKEEEEAVYYCGLDEHAHDEFCYDAEGNLTCQLTEHTHTEECAIEPVTYYCGLEEHTHGESCYDAEGNLTCQLTEHTHTEECAIEPVTYYCGLEEHTHGESCYDAEGNLTCQLTEHTHTEECTAVPVTYVCGIEAHTHTESCYGADGDLVCGKEEHTHTEACLPAVYLCGLEEHAHTDECCDTEGNLICGREEHTHSFECRYDLSILNELSEDDRERVLRVIRLIDEMPSADEIDAKIAEFEEAEDYEGEEAWLTEVYQQVGDVYFEYMILTDQLKAYVLNADKLLELEYIWSQALLIDDIQSDKPTVVGYAPTAEFIELNLYDYNSNINANYNSDNDWPGFQWNGGAYDNGSYSRRKIDYIDFGNSMITDRDYAGSDNGKATTAWNIGNQGGNINEIVEYPDGDYANKPVGITNGTEVIGRNLSEAGYPWVTNAGSMVEYFSNSAFATKMNTTSIEGLFQKDEESGEYYYNSRWNHAQYSNNRFTLYADIITPNFITYPFGNFLPFNDITNSSNATQVGAITDGLMGDYVQEVINDLVAGTEDATEQQLIDMLAKYRTNLQSVTTTGGTAWTTWSAKNAIYDYIGNGPTDDAGPITDALLNKMYNIDWDVKTNFFFGMEMKMHFMQPKGGMTGNDTNQDGESDYPMVFYFTGDDDVWVYIDGTLFLDLSGIHRHVGGEIDFVNGEVHYYALSPATGDVSTTPYATFTFEEILEAAGKSTDVLNDKGTFNDYSTHDFNFYYMERGSGSSVCRLNFNFPLLKKNTISVNKENLAVDGNDNTVNTEVLGNPDYYFNIVTPDNTLFVGPNSKTGVITYKVMDSAGNYIQENGSDKIFSTDEYGIFTLKAGQTAVFEGIEENEGKYFVQELIKAEDNAQYPKVTVNGTESRYNKVIDWSARTYFTDNDNDSETGPYGYKWYGRSGEDTDSSSNASFYFKQQNHVNTDTLGSLSISKALESVTETDLNKTFIMNVSLDGEPIPKGTTYTLTEADGTTTSTGTVETAGQIPLKEGQTATIPNIISGSEFTVSEDSDSADGYIVTYADNSDEAAPSATGVTGVVRVDTEVRVTVTNSENAAVVEIPVTKTLSNGAPDPSVAHSYNFILTRTNENGEALTGDDAYTDPQSITLTGEEIGEAKFSLSYLSSQFEGVTDFPVTFYYTIHEDTDSVTDAIADTSVYLAEISVTKDADGRISAELTSLTKGEEEVTDKTAAFVNTLTEDLSIRKIVDGSTAAQEGTPFQFKLTLTTADDKPLANQSFSATFHNKDGTEKNTVATDADGSFTLSGFYHGETAVIHGLPIGTKWTVVEENADNVLDHYLVSWKITKPAESTGAGESTTANGTVAAGGTEVVFTNTSTYALPETGGAGTTSYTMAGIMLICLSMAFLLYRSSKCRKEVC